MSFGRVSFVHGGLYMSVGVLSSDQMLACIFARV